MKRKFLITTLMLMLVQMGAMAADAVVNGISYFLNNDRKEAKVTGVNSISDGIVTIPETMEYQKQIYTVTCIGDEAFRDKKELKSITIPKTVVEIGDNIFLNSSNITSIVVDKDNAVFDSRNNCNAIIESETDELLFGCQTTKIPDTVTRIGDNAFYKQENLTHIDIPNSVTSIGKNAFFYCSGLTEFVMPNSVVHIGSGILNGCSGLTSVIFSNSLTSIPVFTLTYCPNITTLIIPASVNTIDMNAIDCRNLTDIYFLGNEVPNVDPRAINDDFGAFNSISDITIHVPEGSKDEYDTDLYNHFNKVVDDALTDPVVAGIDIFSSYQKESAFFNLAGQRASATAKGIVIKNGKKVINK